MQPPGPRSRRPNSCSSAGGHQPRLAITDSTASSGPPQGSAMSTSTESYTAAAGQAREATEKTVETFKQGVEKFTDQANVLAKLPTVDLTQPVARYFEYVQKSVDFNRDLATRWAETGHLAVRHRPGAGREGHRHRQGPDQRRRRPGRQAGREGRGRRQRAGPAGRGSQEGAGEAGQGRRAGRRQAGQGAGPGAVRGPDQGRAVRPARERELPKTGTVEELIERLVQRRQRVRSVPVPPDDAGVGSQALPHRRRCFRPPRGPPPAPRTSPHAGAARDRRLCPEPEEPHMSATLSVPASIDRD